MVHANQYGEVRPVQEVWGNIQESEVSFTSVFQNVFIR